MRDMVFAAQPFDCMQHFYSKVQGPVIRACITFRGPLPLPLLWQAAEQTATAVPLLRCTFDAAHRRWRPCGFCARDFVHEVPLTGPRPSQSEIDDVLLRPLAGDGPPVQLFLLRGTRQDVLCVLFSHLLGDGAAFQQYLQLLAACTRTIAAGTPAPGPLSGTRSFTSLLHRLSLRRRLQLLKAPAHSAKQTAGMVLPRQGGTTPQLVKAVLPAPQVTLLRRFAKAHGATFNDLLLTATLRALAAATGSSRVALPCPVDLRRTLGARDETGLCNLTSNYWCAATPAGEPFTTTLAGVAREMQSQKAGDGCLKGPVLLHALFRLLPNAVLQPLFYRLSPVPVTSYTNLGILDDDLLQFGAATVQDAFLCTAIKPAPYFQLTACTFRGACTLSSCFFGGEADITQITGLLQGIASTLASLVAEG